MNEWLEIQFSQTADGVSIIGLALGFVRVSTCMQECFDDLSRQGGLYPFAAIFRGWCDTSTCVYELVEWPGEEDGSGRACN